MHYAAVYRFSLDRYEFDRSIVSSKNVFYFFRHKGVFCIMVVRRRRSKEDLKAGKFWFYAPLIDSSNA